MAKFVVKIIDVLMALLSGFAWVMLMSTKGTEWFWVCFVCIAWWTLVAFATEWTKKGGRK